MANEIISITQDEGYESDYGYNTTPCIVGYEVFGFPSGNANGALRFTNIQINNSQSINMARLYYYVDYAGDAGTIEFSVYGIYEDNTADFSTSPFGRTRTTAKVDISQPAPSGGQHMDINVEPVLSEIVSKGGWANGNAVGLILLNSGTTTDILAAADSANTYLAYRTAAAPNFKPTAISVAAPDLPALDDFGIKISRTGESVLTSVEDEEYFSTRKKQLKVSAQGKVVSANTDPIVIPHGLGKVPLVILYQKVGDNWIKLPRQNLFSLDYAIHVVNSTNLVIQPPTTGTELYYYIFYDQLSA